MTFDARKEAHALSGRFSGPRLDWCANGHDGDCDEITAALQRAFEAGRSSATPSPTGKPASELPSWPPRKGDRAQHRDGEVYTFTGERNANGGFDVRDATGKPKGGIGEQAVDCGMFTLLGPASPGGEAGAGRCRVCLHAAHVGQCGHLFKSEFSATWTCACAARETS